MKEEYWEQFMTTGRIADYLSYKAESGSSESFLHLPEGREDQTALW